MLTLKTQLCVTQNPFSFCLTAFIVKNSFYYPIDLIYFTYLLTFILLSEHFIVSIPLNQPYCFYFTGVNVSIAGVGLEDQIAW